MKFLLTFLIVYTDLSTGERHGYGWTEWERPYDCRTFVAMARYYYGAHKKLRFEEMECSERAAP